MPNFEREVQRIIAEQEIVSKVQKNRNTISLKKLLYETSTIDN